VDFWRLSSHKKEAINSFRIERGVTLRLMAKGRDLATALALVGSAAAVAALFVGVSHSLVIVATGKIANGELTILRGNWGLVAASIAVFLAFFALIPVRLKKDWRSHGIYLAFVVSLFAEMFGFPLSVYFLSGILGMPLLEKDFVLYMLRIGMPVGSLVTFLGVLLIILGWREIYRAKGELATRGVYRCLRHPQYLGIILVAGGWLIHWPTIPGTILWPLLVILYHHLSKREDKYLAETFGKQYSEYAEKTPMPFPRWRPRSEKVL
jgi:protein-S-isoprenylcysteine O-methyltransferase Ste14